ncbi:hypothetical protein D3C74_40350 [compost metagenome]
MLHALNQTSSDFDRKRIRGLIRRNITACIDNKQLRIGLNRCSNRMVYIRINLDGIEFDRNIEEYTVNAFMRFTQCLGIRHISDEGLNAPVFKLLRVLLIARDTATCSPFSRSRAATAPPCAPDAPYTRYTLFFPCDGL